MNVALAGRDMAQPGRGMALLGAGHGSVRDSARQEQGWVRWVAIWSLRTWRLSLKKITVICRYMLTVKLISLCITVNVYSEGFDASWQCFFR